VACSIPAPRAIRHCRVGKIDGVLIFPAIETCSYAMLEIGFPAAMAATAATAVARSV
jgi:hypothetical protein